MILKRIATENFRANKGYVEHSFETGINLITAPNGAGKSSLLIAFKLLLLNKIEGNLDDCINWDGAKAFTIEADWEHRGVNYRSSITYKKSGKTGLSERKLYINDMEKAVAINSDAVTELAKVFEPDLTSASLFSMQGKNEIVTSTDAERRELLKKMRDLTFKKEIENIDSHITIMDEKISKVDKEIFSLESKDYQISELKELPFSEAEKETKVTNLAVLVETKSAFDTKIKLLETTRSHLDSLERRKKVIAGKILNTDLKLKETSYVLLSSYSDEALAQLQQDHRDIYVKKETERVLHDDAGPEFAEAEAEYLKDEERYREEIAEAEEKIKDIKVMRLSKNFGTELREKISELKEANVKNKIESDATQLKLDLCKTGRCPTCSRPFETDHVDEYEAELESFKKAYRDRIKEILGHEAELETKQKEYDDNQENIKTKTALKMSVEVRIAKIDSIHSTIKATKETARVRFEARQKELMAELTSISEENGRTVVKFGEAKAVIIKTQKSDQEGLDIAYKDMIDIEAEIEAVDIPEEVEDQAHLVHDITLLQKDIETYQNTVVINETTEAFNKEKIKKQRQDGKALSKFQTEKSTLLANRLSYVTAKTILQKDFPNYIIERSLSELESDINDFLSRVYTKDLNIKFKQTKVAIKMVYGSENRMISVKNLSGAEKSLTQIGFIDSFNQKQELGCLILDEPDASVDNENSRILFESLGNMAEMYKQLFIISHNVKVRDYLLSEFEANAITLI